MEAYFHAFFNWEQNNQARLLLMTEFIHHNAKNASIDDTLFEFNYGFHLYVFFKNDANPCLKSYSANKLAKQLKDLISTY